MAVFATNIHPSFAETARRRGYLLNDEVSDAEFAGLERQVADLERQIASVDPAAIAEAIREALAPVAGKLAMAERDQSQATLNTGVDEFAGYDLNAFMVKDMPTQSGQRSANADTARGITRNGHADEWADYDLNGFVVKEVK